MSLFLRSCAVGHVRRWQGAAAFVGLMLAAASASAQLTPGFAATLYDGIPRPGDSVGAYNVAVGGGLRNYGPGTDTVIFADVNRGMISAADLRGNVPGAFTVDLPYPGVPLDADGNSVPGDGNDFVVTLEAQVTVPVGTWQIAFGTDDGGWIHMPGIDFTQKFNENGSATAVGLDPSETLWYNAPRGQAWTGGGFTVAAPTNVNFFHGFYENGGGDVSEIAIRNASSGFVDNFNIADGWTLLENGALGWTVMGEVTGPATEALPASVAGIGTAGKATLPGRIENVVTGEVTTFPGQVFVDVFNVGNPGSLDGVRNIALNNTPHASGLMDGPIFWFGSEQGQYPEVFNFGETQPPNHRENYTVHIQGEMLIESNGTINFKDGVDDFAAFIIDTNGDGSLDDEIPIINDNAWTNSNGSSNDGSPISPATFTNVAAGGSWRQFEFWMAEGTGGDNAALAWDFNDTNFSFPTANGDPFNIMDGDDLVPASHLRFQSANVDNFDAVLTLSDIRSQWVFDVDVEQLEWDKIAMSVAPQVGNDTPDNAIIDVDGVEILVNLTGDPTPGLTVDLIDNSNLTEIRGSATFVFSHGDLNDWDTSMFNVNGQLSFMGGGIIPGIAGDYNNSGQVEQADLDLVLLNWGEQTPPVPAGWTNDLPVGAIDQEELDKVLLNWGNTAALGNAAAVPEPTTLMLLAAAAVAAAFRRLRGSCIAMVAVLCCLYGAGQSLAQTQIGGEGAISKVFLTGELQNVVTTPAPDGGVGFVFAERYVMDPDPFEGRFDSHAAQQAFLAVNEPVASGTMAAPIIWTSGNYPPAFGFGPNPGDQDNYGIVITGEMFIPGGVSFIRFKDGNDDIASLVIDLNGDGSLADESPLIDDSNWTNVSGNDGDANAPPNGLDPGGPGSPEAFAFFSGIPAAGAWRRFEFIMAEGSGGDNGALAWDVNDTNFSFPAAKNLPFNLNDGDDLVPSTHLRYAGAELVQSYDHVVSFTGGAIFEVNVEELEWDRIAVTDPPPVLGDNPSVTNIVDFSGGVVTVNLSGNPVPGMTIDLIDDSLNVDEIRGPAEFVFSHGDPALWNTSNFTVNGQITYAGGAAAVLAGDYNGNGRVDQADLDQVLINWGQDGNDLPPGWVTNPPSGVIGQAELDAVLLNWGGGLGAGGGLNTANVPEPSTLALLLVAAGLGLGFVRRRK